MKRLCVIGSLNVDLTITIPRFHAPGETISGTGFATYTGGKGGNQAVALGRLGADVAMAGLLGRDAHGDLYAERLKQEGVDATLIERCEQPTGVALIEVESASGNNRIALNAGANQMLNEAYIDRVLPRLLACEVFLFQLETPLEAVGYAARRLHEAGKTILLDPAPARPLSDELLRCVDYITPNETELALLTGMPTDTPERVQAAAERLLDAGARAVVAKLGARGAMLFSREEILRDDGFRVQAVDTTAAGDSFNAGFACALARGMNRREALRLANAVGALSTTAMGAQAAMPSLEGALALIHSQRGKR